MMADMKRIDTRNYIVKRVHELYWQSDTNCARTTLFCLSELFGVDLDAQTIAAAVGMHGAGLFRAQCGLVEGGLMFIGLYYSILGRPETEAVAACNGYARAFTENFGALTCRELRPGGFLPNDPPHMCEHLTCRTIMFAYTYILGLTRQNGEET